jgi:hypothetical protein
LIHTRRHFKLTAVADDIATINVDYQVLSPVDAHIESQLVQRLMDGEVRFDIGSGRVVSQTMEIDKRILGFAGPTSSMHYIVRMEEKLLEPPIKITAKPPISPAVKPDLPTPIAAPDSKPTTAQQMPSRPKPAVQQNQRPSPARTATRPRTPTKGYQRR